MSTFSSPIELEEEIYFYDTDCGGVVHNLAYLRLVEKARTHLFRDRLQFGPEQMSAAQLFPAVTRTEADYLKPARLGDQLIIRAWFEEIGRLKMTCQFELFLTSNRDQILMKCSQTAILIQMPKATPKRVPSEWRDGVE